MKHKTHLEVYLISLLFMSLLIGGLLLFERSFPEEFNTITGDVLALVNISLGEPQDCGFYLQPGWNFVSFYCISSLEDMEMIDNLSGFEYSFTYRASDSGDPWKSYNPDLPSWVVQDLDHYSRREGYWVYLSSASQRYFSRSGYKNIPTNVPIYPGLNMVGYPTNETDPIEYALLSINDTYTIVYGFDNSAKTYSNYTKGLGGLLNETSPNKAYWINASVGDVWVIDW